GGASFGPPELVGPPVPAELALEGIEKKARRAKLTLEEMLQAERQAFGTTGAYTPPGIRPGQPPELEPGAKVAVPKARALDFDQVLANARRAMAEIQSAASIVNDALQGLFAGLEAGFTSVFDGLLTRTETFASAAKALLRS